ncbi:MAG: SusC/RagA family TonB-linked outer membrane protein [Draconibacterium sp.]|nr:SusC/RagA family TonB-linked outer membrane protein [Draconibacterium sp.]
MKKKSNVGGYYNHLTKFLLVMKLTILILILSLVSVSASTYSQTKKLTLNVKEASIIEIFEQIESQSDFVFVYRNKVIDKEFKFNLDLTESSVEKILEMLFEDVGLTYKINDKQVIIMTKDTIPPKEAIPKVEKEKSQKKQKQLETLTGTVVSKTGQPIPGCAVLIKGTAIGVITDVDGKFTLNKLEIGNTVVFSFLGMNSQEIIFNGQSEVNIILEEDIKGLDEVVVVGYGQQKKVTVTGSISAVNSKELLQSPVANLSNSLAGRASGVIAVQRSGEPGEDKADIRIRGIGTFAGSQDPLILVDGVETSSYNNIDPNEIKNISILKDASSTAVYGVRGANGVIIITTKRGKLGKPKISISSNVAGTSITEYRERMDAYDYTRLFNEALKYESYVTGAYEPFFTDDEIELYRNHSNPVYYPDIDWMKMMYKDISLQHQHNLNISGGTEFVKYFVSVGLFGQQAQFNNTNLQKDFFDQQTVFNRYNFRSNFDFNMSKRLKAKLNIAAKIENKRGINSNNVTSFIRGISLANPIGTPGIVDGKFVTIETNKTGRLIDPFNGLYNGHRKTYRNYLEGLFRLDYDLGFITKGLSTHASISFENFNSFYNSYNKPRETYVAVINQDNETVLLKNYDDGAFSTKSSSSKRRQSYFEAGINYAREFKGGHNLTAMLLYNQQKKFNPSFQYGIPIGYQGLVGRVTYDYKNKYLIEYNAGYNGTENFAPGKRFGYFPAYSLGWVLSEESFFPKNDIVSFVKFRGSYGEVGNDRVGGDRFLYLPSAYIYDEKGVVYYWGEVGSTEAPYNGAFEGKIGNPDVTWERARKLNVGFEMTFLKNKLRIIGDVFQEKRDNILMTPNSLPVIAGMGKNAPAVNMGKVENSGYDGEISFNDNLNGFHYWVKGNMTYAKNKIIFQDEVQNPYPYLMRTGLPIGQFFGYVSDGLYNTWEEVNDAYRPYYNIQNNLIQPGEIQNIDVNGDGVIDQFDQAPIGYPSFPEINYGISFGGEYKGFDFSVLFQGASNVTFIGADRHISGWSNWQGNNKYLLTSWSQERYEQGLPINFPHLNIAGSSISQNAKSSYFAEDASYVRLKNAEVGYRFDGLAFMKRIGLESARVYLNGSNLWTWAYGGLGKRFPGVDPEDRSLISGEQPTNTEPYPRIMVVNLGLNLNF